MLTGSYCLPTAQAQSLINRMPNALRSFAARKWDKIASRESQDWGYPSQRHAQSVKEAERFISDLYQKMQRVPLPCPVNCTDDEIKDLAAKYASEYEALIKKYQQIADLFQLSPPVTLEQRLSGESQHRGYNAVIDFVRQMVTKEADSFARRASNTGLFIGEHHLEEIYRLGFYRALLERIKHAGFDPEAMFGFNRENLSKEEIAALQQVHLKKMCDPMFWRRWLRKLQSRGLENIYRSVGFVSARKQLYVSNDSLARYRRSRARNKALLQSVSLINELGQQFTLEELSAVSNSNPAIRRAELMVRIAGFEYIAVNLGHAGEFVTLTCPSRFHPRHHQTGAENKKYDGSTPVQAIQYLGAVWAKIRSALKRAAINIYGFRVTEPHHDGTPHWHCLLFMAKDHVDRFRRIVARYACADSRRELGLYYQDTQKAVIEKQRADRIKYNQYAQANGLKPRCQFDLPDKPSYQTAAAYWDAAQYSEFAAVKSRIDFTAINWNKGTAAGYIAKYIAKNIDGKTVTGASIGGDYESNDLSNAIETAERVACWASVHGIRQFQQIGGPPVTIWRELRRLDKKELTATDDYIVRAALAADAGDWGRFTQIMGGVEIKRKDRPVQLYKEKTELLNKYGEERPALIYGVIEPETGLFKISRLHDWEVVLKKGGYAAAWTCVNNCTKSNFSDLPLNSKSEFVHNKPFEAKPFVSDIYLVKKYNLYAHTVNQRYTVDNISDKEAKKHITYNVILAHGYKNQEKIAELMQPDNLRKTKVFLANYKNIRHAISDDIAIESIRYKALGKPSLRTRNIIKEKNYLALYAAGLLPEGQAELQVQAQLSAIEADKPRLAYNEYLRQLDSITPPLSRYTGIGIQDKEPVIKVSNVKKRKRWLPGPKPLTTDELIAQSEQDLLAVQNWLADLAELAA